VNSGYRVLLSDIFERLGMKLHHKLRVSYWKKLATSEEIPHYSEFL